MLLAGGGFALKNVIPTVLGLIKIGDDTMSESKKPDGWRAFDSLAKALVNIPKETLDRKVAKDKAKRIAKRKKKK